METVGKSFNVCALVLELTRVANTKAWDNLLMAFWTEYIRLPNNPYSVFLSTSVDSNSISHFMGSQNKHHYTKRNNLPNIPNPERGI